MTVEFYDAIGNAPASTTIGPNIIQLHGGKVVRFFIPGGTVAEIPNRRGAIYTWDAISFNKGWKWPFVSEHLAFGSLYCRAQHASPASTVEEVENLNRGIPPAKDQKALLAEALSLLPEEANSRIVSIHDNKPFISLVIETIATERGYALRDQILYNNLIPAYSMRAFGNAKIETVTDGGVTRKLIRGLPVMHVATWDNVDSPALPECRFDTSKFPDANVAGGLEKSIVPPTTMRVADSSSFTKSLADYAKEEIASCDRAKIAVEALTHMYDSAPLFVISDSGDMKYCSGTDYYQGSITLFLDSKIAEPKIRKTAADVKREIMKVWKG